MKLCIVQTRPHRGQLEENLNAHLLWVAKAAALGAEVVVFPELSLTGYEPEMAERLALEEDSSFFEPLAKQVELSPTFHRCGPAFANHQRSLHRHALFSSRRFQGSVYKTESSSR